MRISRPKREWYEQEFKIGLNAFGAFLGGDCVNPDVLKFLEKYIQGLIRAFELAKTEKRLFIMRTVGPQKRRGYKAGICDAAEVEIDTDAGRVKKTLLRFFDDNKGEGGYVTPDLLKGLEVYPMLRLERIARENEVVRVTTKDRYTGEQRLYEGVLIGNKDEKWQSIVYSMDGKLQVQNINVGPATAPETQLKLCNFSKHVDLTAAEKAMLRAQLISPVKRRHNKSTISKTSGEGPSGSESSQQLHIQRRPQSVILRRRGQNAVTRHLTRSARSDMTLKNVEDLAYHIHNRTVEATREHNKLQNRLYQFLVGKFGVENVLMEHNWVDIEVRDGNNVTLYEIKPFPNPLLCIREALGQIVLYGWRYSSKSGVNLKLTIVGPSALAPEEKSFLSYLRQQFQNRVDYLAVDQLV